MGFASDLRVLGDRALTAALQTGTALLKVVRPGDRVPAPEHDPGLMAPWPNIDRYPITIGSNLTFQYITACQRLARTGYRLQWVDLLDELLLGDPSAYSNLSARILATAGGRLQVVSAGKRYPHTEQGDAKQEKIRIIRQEAGLGSQLPDLTDDERVLADQIAAHVQRQIDELEEKPQVISAQLWATYYGIAANELLWNRTPNEWQLKRLHYIHPRRIAYPDQNNWHPHLWDQGLVVTSRPGWQHYLTSGLFGLDVYDYPNKFAVHVPRVVPGYPTTDGVGMVIAFWMAMKRMGARSYVQFVEKWAKPGTVATYNTKGDNGKPRNANDADIALASQVVQQIGFGGAPGAAIPDSIELELFGPAANKGATGTSDPAGFTRWCDEQVARAIRTTDALQGLQSNGARSALEVLQKGANRVAFYDGMCLSSTWTRDIGGPIARLNYPSLERLCPAVVLVVDDEPGPEVLIERIKDGVSIGMPIDADKAAAATGMASLIADKGNPDARILYVAKALEAFAPQKQAVEPEKPETLGADPGGKDEPAPENDEEES